jgi:hypothetical protein
MKVFLKTYGWPMVTVARDGSGSFAKDKCLGIKRLEDN